MNANRLRLSVVSVLAMLVIVACGNGGTVGNSATTASTGAAAKTAGAAPATVGAATTTGSATTKVAGSSTNVATSSAGAPSTTGNAGGTIKIGSKNFTEEYILAEMYAQLLESKGLKVERKLRLGATDVAQQALVRGDIDLYPEYTSTGLLTVLKGQPSNDRQQIFNAVKSGYEQQFKVTWLEPSPFNDTQALAMTKAGAAKAGVKTYSELATKANALVLGGPPEFLEREDGLKALQKAYGGFQFKSTKQLDPGLRYGALTKGDIDVVVAFGTDGQIGGFDLQLLEDDKHFYPPYQAAPVVRQDTLAAHPEIAGILNALAPKLDDTTMAKLNWEVDGPNKKEPAAVAKDFLTVQGLLK
ncbi:MAG: glycine betaine ABC transporter substrate-binding protein [Herpetosiphon sp.]